MVRKLAMLTAAVVLAACGGDDKEPENAHSGFQPAQQQPQPYDQQQGQGQQQPQPPQGGAVTSDPNTLQGIIAGALAGTAATMGALTGGEIGPVQEGIKMTAQTRAKGMQPDGQLMSAKLQQGGHAEGVLMMQPGKCYTVVGFGGLGVMNYQINLITAPPLPPQVIAQSATGSNAPVVGPNEQCVRNPNPFPTQVKVDMHVIGGTGMVGAQAYSK